MFEVLSHLLSLTFWDKLANVHGLLSMLALILFGAGILLYFVVRKSANFAPWLRNILLILFINLAILDIAGLTVYVRYRASGGPRDFLKSSESTAWLHNIIFEHKELLAFAVPLLILVAFFVTRILGDKFNDESLSPLRKSVIFSLVLGLIFVLVIAAEAVLVTKVAPVK